MKKTRRVILCCSFCGKPQHEVRRLIAGPMVYICDECISFCNDIIAEPLEESAPSKRTAEPRRSMGGLAVMATFVAKELRSDPKGGPFAKQAQALAKALKAASAKEEALAARGARRP